MVRRSTRDNRRAERNRPTVADRRTQDSRRTQASCPMVADRHTQGSRRTVVIRLMKASPSVVNRPTRAARFPGHSSTHRHRARQDTA